MAAFAQIGVIDPYELERLAEELAGRAKGTSYRYELPEHPLLRAENLSFDVEEFDISFTFVLARLAR